MTAHKNLARALGPAHQFIKPLLFAWWAFIGFIGLALLGNILLVPLSQTPGNWADGVQAQVAELLRIARSYPVQTGIAGILIGVLTFLSLAEQVAARRASENTPQVIVPADLPRPASLLGRGNEFSSLMAFLRTRGSQGAIAIEGMAGAGKTALAAEAVARLSRDHVHFPGGAAWILCEGLEGSSGLDELWIRVARALRLSDTDALSDPETRRIAVVSALAKRRPILLALDNVEPGLDADTIVDNLFVEGHTRLILTARQPVASDRVTRIEVGPLQNNAAADLLTTRLQQLDPSRPNTEERPDIPVLVEVVGGLPLAIELTASYAAIQHLPLAEVAQEVIDDELNAGAFRQDPKKSPSVRFGRTWRVLLPHQQQLFMAIASMGSSGSGRSGDVLQFYEGASFPRTLATFLAEALYRISPGEPEPNIDVAVLVSYALIEALPGGEFLRLHPLLRSYGIEQLMHTSNASREKIHKTIALVAGCWQQALVTLDVKLRIVMLLSWYYSFSDHEAAQVLDITPAAVRMRRHEALVQLLPLLEAILTERLEKQGEEQG